MPLYFKKTVLDNLIVVIWKLDESLERLKSEVYLTLEEINSLDEISLPNKQREFLSGKYVIKKACSLLGIEFKGLAKDEFGKPFLVGREFEISLTHTEDYIGVVFSLSGPVGIDLEKPREQILRIFPRLFSEEEQKAVANNLDSATIYWSAKEALYKLYGRRSVNFKNNLFLYPTNSGIRGEICMNDIRTTHKFHIQKVDNYYLVVAN